MLFRLWLIPLIVVTIGLFAVLASQVSGRLWTGPLVAWLAVGAAVGGYLWEDFGVLSATPIRMASPSQVLAMPLALAAAWGLVRFLDVISRCRRGPGSASWRSW